MLQEDIVVIPLPTLDNRLTYATARLVVDETGRPFAEAIAAIPNTVFAPPRRISLSPESLLRIAPGNAGRPTLYLYEGMILNKPRFDA